MTTKMSKEARAARAVKIATVNSRLRIQHGESTGRISVEPDTRIGYGRWVATRFCSDPIEEWTCPLCMKEYNGYGRTVVSPCWTCRDKRPLEFFGSLWQEDEIEPAYVDSSDIYAGREGNIRLYFYARHEDVNEREDYLRSVGGASHAQIRRIEADRLKLTKERDWLLSGIEKRSNERAARLDAWLDRQRIKEARKRLRHAIAKAKADPYRSVGSCELVHRKRLVLDHLIFGGDIDRILVAEEKNRRIQLRRAESKAEKARRDEQIAEYERMQRLRNRETQKPKTARRAESFLASRRAEIRSLNDSSNTWRIVRKEKAPGYNDIYFYPSKEVDPATGGHLFPWYLSAYTLRMDQGREGNKYSVWKRGVLCGRYETMLAALTKLAGVHSHE
jgi:hypothetical protein